MFYKLMVIAMFFSISSLSANSLENIKSFKANFVQKITNASKKDIEYKGEVFIKNSGKVLWKYKTPIIKNVYVNKDFAIVDEPELEQAIFTKLQNEINIIKLLKEAKQVSENKYIAKLYEVNYEIFLTKNKISSIKYKDELENNIVIVFSNTKENIVIDDKVFTFIAPSYYDIIRK